MLLYLVPALFISFIKITFGLDYFDTELYIRRLSDGELELFVSSKRVMAKLLTTATDNSISMLISTNGESLIRTIYDGQSSVKDCDIVENREMIDNFTQEVEETMLNSESYGEEDENNFESKIKLMINFKKQKHDCRQFQRNIFKLKLAKTKLAKSSRQKRSYLIFPGTNWCGKGNTADYAQHLGLISEVDVCCRTHDQCPFAIEGFSSRYNVFNYRLHTLSHCDCDRQ